MSDIVVRLLLEEDWQTYRQARLDALQDSPDAFAASYEDEEKLDESEWRDRMNRSRRLLAEKDGETVGVVSVGSRPDTDDRTTELFGLWVVPQQRGSGVAWQLVKAGARQAGDDGFGFLAYWVGTDNGRGVAFASSFGFRPTDARRPMRVGGGDEDEEMRMIYSLHDPVNE
ncbi:RimJ/RimL family protein N-acetyltransferase [Branchiibius hedensis]|uniref:Protein N-acetyltransferase, RimJ/RimL family n=1 Tax=Branchiibius hedensis TaxID=672460 RepID=A0A2Y8ZN96_9MICO|nr:GNAT family N-acetyltransferase [Branchiibius hedensis]PWJ24018.1 RimJ/RimL family protein N-acetyltransferase [Branchiibius hedensis]SSA32836.1 Protein N-acetyltransferase, RimJ/RimL family [Branchiibius hedensis]